MRIVRSILGRRGVAAAVIGRGTAAATNVGVAAGVAILIGAATASAAGEPEDAGRAATPAFDHAVWDRLVSQYVDAAGRVAYRDLARKDKRALDAYLQSIARASPEAWPEAEQIAFWINAYNAGIVAAVLEGRTAEAAIGRVKLFKFWKLEAAGRQRTLDEIEHEILRRRFDEPRIHFALVCASASCPPLRREAYRAADLGAQLEDQGRTFLGDPQRNVIDRTAPALRLSAIFDWFREDFDRAAGSVPRFVARYVSDEATRAWLEGDVRVEHLDYDWTLNAQPEQRLR